MTNDEIKEKILEFLEPGKLPILDGLVEEKDYYTGVTIEYLSKYVLNDLDIDRLALIMLDLLDNELVDSLYCSDAKEIVFGKKGYTGYYTYKKDSKEYENSDSIYYTFVRRRLSYSYFKIVMENYSKVQNAAEMTASQRKKLK